jgi:4-amino-4-deoxy-L-arabinose transferase-like glycosyltransferase
VRLVRSHTSWARIVTYGVIAAAAVIAVRNALVYPAIVGYDAQEAIDYAQGLVKDGRLPEGTGSYYTPPGFFAIGGLMIEVAERFDYDDVARGGQIVDALAAVGTLLLLLVLLRLLWPGRDVLHLAAVVFFVVCPVVMKSAAMFHPEPLSMLLSTAALVLAARLLLRPDHRLLVAAALGVTLGLAQLVRAWTLWTVGVVVVVLAVAAVTRRAERRPLLAALAVVIALAAVVPVPWYAHQLDTYDSALFGQPHPSEPVWSRRPLGFFVGAGLPEVVTEPYRPSFSGQFLPIAYAETWGDYFGVWRWLPNGAKTASDVRRELVTMSIVGLPLTLMAVAGWMALLALAVRHPGRATERQLIALLPLAALAGVLYFATSYPTPDGDTVKGSFMLTAVPAWAACFGFAFDEMRRRFPRGSAALLLGLAALALVAAPFLFAPTGA